MGYGINHYTYQNIVDPNRPRPAKPPSKVPPRLTDAQKADALARILAVKTEIEAREAEAIAKVTEAREKVVKLALDLTPEAVPDLEEARKVIRSAQLRAARTRYQDKINAEADAARDALLKLKAENNRKHCKRWQGTARDEAKLVDDYRAGLPTARELMTEAQIAELIERVDKRRAKKKEDNRRRDARRTAARQKAKVERLNAEAAEVERKLRALIVSDDHVLAFEAYLSRAQHLRDKYYHTVGRPLSDEEETRKERELKARLLKRLEEDPNFLDRWRVSRSIGSPVSNPVIEAKRKIELAQKHAKRKAVRRAELFARREEIEAKLAALCTNQDRAWAVGQYVRKNVKYSQKWRVKANLPRWQGEELDFATLRIKARLVDRLAIERDYLDSWYTVEKAKRTRRVRRRVDRIKADPAKYAAYRAKANETRTKWREKKKAEKAAEPPPPAQVETSPAPVEPVVDDAVYQKTLRRLTRIFEKARRDAARRDK